MIQSYLAAMPFVLTVRVSFEARPGDQGYLAGVDLAGPPSPKDILVEIVTLRRRV